MPDTGGICPQPRNLPSLCMGEGRGGGRGLNPVYITTQLAYSSRWDLNVHVNTMNGGGFKSIQLYTIYLPIYNVHKGLSL